MSYWNWWDVLWVTLLYPVVQILGTMRHELSHAVAGKLAGRKILQIRLLPERRDGGIVWGYVRFDQPSTKVILLAPYKVAAVSLLIGVGLCWWLYQEIPFFWWLFLGVTMVISPMVDVLYNYVKGYFFGTGDFARAMEVGE